MYRPLLTAASLAFALGSATMHGHATSLPDSVATPLPFARPDNPAKSIEDAVAAPMSAAMPVPDHPNATGSIPPTEPDGSLRTGRLPVAPELKAALDAISSGDVRSAIATRNGLAEGSLDRQILTWAIASSGAFGVTSDEIEKAQRELKGWPALKNLRTAIEHALYWESPPAAEVIAAFQSQEPVTTDGAILLARAYQTTGQAENAARTIRRLWLSESFEKRTEDRIIKEFGSLLTAADHRGRMDFLMHKARASQAKRFAELAQAEPIYRAWLAVINNAKNAQTLLDRLEADAKADPAVLFARIELLRRQDKYEEAATLLEKAPRDEAKLINTTEWWNERRIVARGLADQGDYRRAYKIAADYVSSSPTDIVDAEFHAGWYALRNLGEPEKAEKHFRKILETSNRPLSASRALYWLGRAAEAGGPGDAKDLFTQAARYSGTFYGQLASARLNLKTLDVSYPAPTTEDRDNFENREPVRAIARLEYAGHTKLAGALYRALADELTSPGELAMLASRAESQDNHALSLQIGKTAFGRGINVAALAYPVGVIPTGANIEGSGKALAYAIARQESAFNPAAVSPANARGLLQILPGTAQGVAKRHGIGYAPAKLTTDPGYNATLGAHYLGEQIDAFAGSYILTFIAYNAGPRRVSEWIARYGDPRGKEIDEVIDWIERIPFPETRNYVQRVMENYQVYKTRLGQDADIEADLRFGRK